ncbi:Smr/MutS family protein [Rhodobacteraceae bacterium nBUS_24]
MSRRKLKPEEKELWQQVAQTATPLFGAQTRPLTAEKKFIKKPPKTPQLPRITPFEIGSQTTDTRPTFDLKPELHRSLEMSRVQMDKRAFEKLKRGKMKPEATIDLHGLTLGQAQPALVQFILAASTSGKRLVLVITGKGKAAEDYGPIPRQKGILRHHVPHWLGMAPMAPFVLQVSAAHIKHGGGGAYYVYLKRKKPS